MFKLFKKDEIAEDTVFGKVKKNGKYQWESIERFPITLFSRIYNIKASACIEINSFNQKSVISEVQSNSLRNTLNKLIIDRERIEEAIVRRFKISEIMNQEEGRLKKDYVLSNYSRRLVLQELVILYDGSSALFISDDAENYGEYDDWDEGFVVTIIPEIKTYSKELYMNYMDYPENLVNQDDSKTICIPKSL